jgi:hypothetical protein
VQADTSESVCNLVPKGGQKRCRMDTDKAVSYLKSAIESGHGPFCRPLCGLWTPGPPSRSLAGDWKCPFCQFIAEQAEEALRNKHTDHEILHFLRHECKKLPPSFADPCMNYVNTEGVIGQVSDYTVVVLLVVLVVPGGKALQTYSALYSNAPIHFQALGRFGG